MGKIPGTIDAPSAKVEIPKIGVPGIHGGHNSSSSSSEDDRRRNKPDLKLPMGKLPGKIEAPSAKVEIPKIGVPGIHGKGGSSSSSSDGKRRGFEVSNPGIRNLDRSADFVSSSDSSEEARKLGYVRAEIPIPDVGRPDLSSNIATGNLATKLS